MTGLSAKALVVPAETPPAADGGERRPIDAPEVQHLLLELAAAEEPAARCVVLLDLSHRVWIFDLSLALAYAQEGVSLARRHGLAHEEALCELAAGRMLRLMGRYAEAERILPAVRDVLMACGDREGAGIAVRTLSAIYLDLGLLEQALDLNREALQIFNEIGHQLYYCKTLTECADVLKSRGEFDEALAIIDSARARLEATGDTNDEIERLQLKYTRTLTLSDAGRSADAVTAASEALEAARQFDSTNIVSGCRAVLALAHARLGQFEESRRYVDQFLANIDAVTDPFEQISGLLNYARAELAAGQGGRALGRTEQALTLAKQIGLKGLMAQCHAALADIDQAIDAHAAALGHFKAFYAIERELHTVGIEHRIGQMQLQIRVDEARMETLEKARQDLERLVTERTQQMRLAKEQAEIANRSKSDFLAHMSHELRTPLNAVIGFAELLTQEVHGPLGSPKYREYITDIHDSGTLLLSLINDILNLSKIEAGKQELSREICSVEDICLSCLRLVRDRATQAGIAIKLSLQPNLRLLDVDVRAIKQVLLNLLTNAVKFTLEGGHVTLFATDDGVGPYVTLGVRDTGIGIAAEDLPRVLEPFGQVRNSYTKTQPGTGLGLPLAKLLTELHDGKFAIESTLGEGTLVTVALPIADMATWPPGTSPRKFNLA
jgi:signal transduction histidine kinase